MKITMILLAVIAYMAVMLYIGLRSSKKNASADDFYLGGRKLGPFVTAMSAEASDMSSWLLMGLSGVALLTGIAGTPYSRVYRAHRLLYRARLLL